MTRYLQRKADLPEPIHMLKETKDKMYKTKCGKSEYMIVVTGWHTDVTCWDCLEAMGVL